MTVSVSKVITVDKKQLFIMLHRSEKNDIQFNVLNLQYQEAFGVLVTDFQLRALAAELRMPFKEYMTETLSAFSGTVEQPQYSFEFSSLDGCLKWKKIIEENQIKLNLGEIILEEKNFQTVAAEMLILSSSELTNFARKTQELNTSLEKSLKNMKDAEALLQEAVKAKEEIETEYFTKFALILNAKKRKIRELYRTIEELQSKDKGKKIIAKPVTTSSKDIDDILNQPGPSRLSKRLDHSLNLDDDEEEVPPPKQYKLRRRLKVSEQVPDQPKSKSRVSQTRANKISSSEDEEDVDGLLENM